MIRHQRAWAAERIEGIEEKRAADITLSEFSPEEKQAVVQHDQWVRDEDG